MRLGLGIGLNRLRRGGGGFNPAALFANVGATPAFVYSTVKLVEAYAGPAIRVVRPSDSVEADIGFDGYRLDEAALYAHIGVQNGEIIRWYDQSGAGNHSVAQATAIRRFQIGLNYRHNGNLVPYRVGAFVDLPAISIDRRAFSLFIAGRQRGISGLQGFFKFGAAGASTFATNSLFSATYPVIHSKSVTELVFGPSSTLTNMNGVTFTGGAQTAGTDTGGTLGANSAGYLYIGDANAFVGYQSTLSVGDRNAVKAALAYSYDIGVSANPKIVFVGDSITQGANDPRNNGFAIRSLDLIGTKLDAYVSAGGGSQVVDVVAAYGTSFTKTILTTYSAQECYGFIHIGTNDLTIGGRSAAQIYADIQTLAASMRADGALVIVSTILANSGWNGTQQTTRNDLNTLIRTNWASFADGLCDFAADPVMGTQAAASNGTLFGDGLHPSSVGHQNLAVLAASAIQTLFIPVAPSITGVPTISGTTTENQTLTATAATVSGIPSPTRTWQWRRDGADIGGATASTYLLVTADVGTVISVRQTETNGSGTANATSANTATIAADLAFSPASLFQASEAGFWVPVTMSRLWQDTARTTPVTAVGQTVASWELTTASGVIYATQADPAQRPTYRENVNGKGYLDTDLTDFMSIPVNPSGAWDFVMSYTAAARNFVAFSATSTNEYWVFAGISADGSTNLSDTARVAISAFYFNNTLSTNTTRAQNYTSAQSATRLHCNVNVIGGAHPNALFGKYQGGLQYAPGPIYGLMYRAGTMDATQRANLDAWMADLQNP